MNCIQGTALSKESSQTPPIRRVRLREKKRLGMFWATSTTVQFWRLDVHDTVWVKDQGQSLFRSYRKVSVSGFSRRILNGMDCPTLSSSLNPVPWDGEDCFTGN